MNSLRVYTLGIITVLISLLVYPLTARADAVGLRLAPLKYEQTITSTKPQQGFIDVSNPSDASVAISTSVQGFRQSDSDGNLEYFDSTLLSNAITPDLTTFTLGPREVVRATFTVDPAKLPAGGVYAVLFFKTVPASQSSGSSYVSQSAKVGTLLILNNGGIASVGGSVTPSLNLFQFGTGLTGRVAYAVPPTTTGLTPKLTVKAYPWGKPTALTTGLVLPGSTRIFEIRRTGSYFGIIPLTFTDIATGKTATRWVIACTGLYQTGLVVLIAFLVALGLRWKYRPKRIIQANRRLLDGLSHHK